MPNWIAVALGGAVGSCFRYSIAVFGADRLSNSFPFATLAVNLMGCFLIGLFSERLPEALRLLMMTGFLGGFTTFSAFGLEGLQLLRSGQVFLCSFYVLSSVLGGFPAVWLGTKC